MLRQLARSIAIAAFAGGVAACSPSATPGPATPAGSTPAPSSPPSAGPASSDVAPSPSQITGFAFDPESIVGYYATLGYTCSAPQPSAYAADYQVTACQLVDPAGRTRVVGVVADTDDDVADAYASIHGAAGETIVDPVAVLEPFGAFLGAMLGGPRGESLLEWLAGHVGDDFAETTIDALHVATYIKDGDRSTLYLEIANDAYLAAPSPKPS